MKQIIIVVLVSLICTAYSNASDKVETLDYSEFESEILTNVDCPFVILFGSNYCRYSIEQLKLLKRIASCHSANFRYFCVNADKDENYEWLKKVWFELRFNGEVGVPVWLFYGRSSKYQKQNHIGANWAGCMDESEIIEIIEDMIETYQYLLDDE